MMTTEVVLLMFIYATILFGAVVKGPIQTFKKAAPKLGARIERNVTTGRCFTEGNSCDAGGGSFPVNWVKF